MINRHQKCKLLILAMLLTFMLTGCSIKTPLTENKLSQEFQSTTTSLLRTKRLAAAKAQNKTKEQKKFNRVFNRQAKVEQKRVEKAIKGLESGSKFTGFPKDVLNYSKEVDAYIKAVINTANPRQLEKKYHEVAKSAIVVGTDDSSKKIKNYITSIVANDGQLTATQNNRKNFKIGKNSRNESNKKGRIDSQALTAKGKTFTTADNKLKARAEKTHKKISQVNIQLGWGIFLLVISGFLIVTIFMQPAKSDDTSKALMDQNVMPKPRGYELFMKRATELLTVILVIVLISMERG